MQICYRSRQQAIFIQHALGCYSLSPLEGVTALGNIGNGEEDIIPKIQLLVD